MLDNQILALLCPEEYQLLFLNLENVSLTLGQVIYEFHQQIEYVYFPIHSMISLVSILSDKSTTEIGLIGNEGMVGLPVFLGCNYATSHTMVQVGDSAMRLNAEIFKKESQKNGDLSRLLLLYTQARLTQISQNLVCKTHHHIENQFACWLLFVHDSVNKDELLLTQHFIAQMLGVRRASVSEIAQKFQKAGIISYNRGIINVLNRAMLESRACECYDLVKSEFRSLLNFH